MKFSLAGFVVFLAFGVARSSKTCSFEGVDIVVSDSFDCQSYVHYAADNFRFPWFPWHRFPILSTIWPILRPTTEAPSDDEECPAEGIKQISHPDSCDKYILCIGGNKIERRCAPGFHFSRELRNCVAPEIAECEERKWSCPEEDDLGNLVFIPNEESCSKYYLCFGGDQIPLSCAEGLHWSIEDEMCVDKKKAGCDFEEEEDDIEVCPESGVKQISHPDNCEKFILCVGGNKFERNCAPGFHFSRKTRTCEVAEEAGCKDFDSKLQCPDNDDLDELVFLPSPETCSKYYLCFGGEPLQMSCADGLHWSPEHQACLNKKIAGCEIDEDFEECPESGVKSISHPSDCAKYVLCVGGTRFKRTCGAGLHFSRELRNCVQPDLAQCEESKYTCPEEDDGDLVFLPNTEDCSSYFVCFGGEPIPLSCGAGLHWSAEEQSCVNKGKANCEYGDDDDTEKCPEEGIKQISHPDSCEKYILCMGGSEMNRNCAPGFHFSRDFRTCVPPAMANCE